MRLTKFSLILHTDKQREGNADRQREKERERVCKSEREIATSYAICLVFYYKLHRLQAYKTFTYSTRNRAEQIAT